MHLAGGGAIVASRQQCGKAAKIRWGPSRALWGRKSNQNSFGLGGWSLWRMRPFCRFLAKTL